MRRKAISRTMLAMLLIDMLTLAFNIQQVQPLHSLITGWNKPYGIARSEWAFCVVKAVDGGYMLAGVTRSFGAGRGDFWLVKVDSSGNKEWDKTYGGDEWDQAYCVVETSDKGYALAGVTESYGTGGEALLVKVDSSGNKEWSRTYGGGNVDCAFCVIETNDEGYVLAGVTESFGAGNGDFWLVKTDSAGNVEWNRTHDGARHYDVARSVVETSNGGYSIAGYTHSFGAGKDDFWLLKTDVNGNMEWNRTYGGANDDRAFSLVQTSDGGYALAGYTFSFGSGSGDFWLVKTDSYGNHQWNRTWGGVDHDVAHSVVQTGDGGYVLAGITESFGAGGEALLVKVDSSGNKKWNKTYGGDGWDEAYCVVEANDGGYILAGNTGSYGADDEDFWLVKVDSSGNKEWSKIYGGSSGFGELPLYIGLASAIIIATIAIAIAYVKQRKL